MPTPRKATVEPKNEAKNAGWLEPAFVGSSA